MRNAVATGDGTAAYLAEVEHRHAIHAWPFACALLFVRRGKALRTEGGGQVL